MLTNVLEYLENSVRQYPDSIAFEDEANSMTFAELGLRAKSIGSFLAQKNLHNQPIMVLMETDALAIAGFMGVVYSGNFYCPIDVSMPVERMDTIIKVLNPKIILTDDANRKTAESLDYTGDIFTYEQAVSNSVNEEQLLRIRRMAIDTDPLYCLFTSGSTGVPKGALMCHRSLIDLADWFSNKFQISDSDVFGNQAPFFFDLSVPDIYCTIKCGCKCHIIPKDLFKFPVDLLKYIEEKQITMLNWITSALCTIANLKALKKKKPDCIKKVFFIGEVMPNSVLNIWRKELPNVLYVNLYGPTEITYACTYYIVDREFTDSEPLPIGFPCENSDIIVLNDEDKPVKAGEAGELCVRGSSLSLGYYNNPEKTAEVFVQNPLNSAYPEIIYRTGDLVKYNEFGELMYLSRKDFQIKHKGYRIELGEIEAASGAIKEIESCACLYNENKKKIVLFYTGTYMTAEKISEELSLKINNYMLPGEYIHLDKLPYNANGKIDRKKLKEDYL